jgi:tripartite-type tricarboxylate transporter receptor subunit TctC
MRAQLENEGAVPAPSSASDFAAFVRDDVQRWAPIVRQSGARPD